ncbi:carboxylate-amine ligase [Nocardiopsis trehalosi]|jgi:carboxylate-amine ligase|uniref:carboxylate-amine ligase n=1 Tax=Nocardiopsis trehalosi TaxID=109329 RepID=UPI0008317D6A|nr:glutamate--cysteine ligase [Nocardiopsis trehalosi]
MTEPGTAGRAGAHGPAPRPGGTAGTAAASGPGTVPAPTVGAEEEFFVVDPGTRVATARAPEVLAAAARPGGAAGRTRAELCAEMTRYQVEAAGPVSRNAAELRGHLLTGRAALVEAAAQRGLAIAATGTAVLGDVACAPLSTGDRYRAIADAFGALRDAHAVCGQHVHVGVADPDTAVAAANHLRPWLPTLLALTANSPFHRGRDTGHASWRWSTWSRLPSAGPPPLLASAAAHDEAVEDLLRSGAALDRRMVYWDVRPSAHLPTLEIRVGDTAATVEEALLVAVVVRGLVATALAAVADGHPPPAPDDRVLRLAMWRAARDGLEGCALDPVTRAVLPARRQAEAMLAAAAPGLRACGEEDTAHALLGRVVAAGSGARRQRAAYERRGRMADVVDLLVRQTRFGLAAADR